MTQSQPSKQWLENWDSMDGNGTPETIQGHPVSGSETPGVTPSQPSEWQWDT